jgi:ribosomal protein L16/L10AE
MRLASHKLPIKCKFASKADMDDVHLSHHEEEEGAE